MICNIVSAMYFIHIKHNIIMFKCYYKIDRQICIKCAKNKITSKSKTTYCLDKYKI